MRYSNHAGERGSALIITLMVVLIIGGLAMGVMMTTYQSSMEHISFQSRNEALYLAESGISNAIANLTAGGTGNLGSQTAPVTFDEGSYWVFTVDNGDGTFRVTSNGTHPSGQRAIEAVLLQTSGGIYNNAVFAGNSSGDPNYDLTFGGWGTQADSITGDVYSGNNIDVSGNAAMNGVLRATNSITGAGGITGVTQPIPDIPGMNYEVNNDYNVAQEFATGGATYGYWNKGGNAWQLPEANPAHFFRKNPSDRQTEWSGTAKEDYFIEDRFEYFGSDPNANGASAARVTLSGAGGEPGPPGNHKVYFIDGNLWLHNKYTYSFKFYTPEADGMQVTFVVKGNIYFSDNMFLLNQNKDGVAFIAMKDDAVADSGNIYFGDPVFGTLKEMNAFLYAENNFYDNNLDAAGSAKVTLNGNMTAGNQVQINRDYGDQHSKLTVNFDDRVMTGDLNMPGLPSNGAGQSQATYSVVSWREIAPAQ